MTKRQLKQLALLAVALYATAFVVFNATQYASVWLLPWLTVGRAPTLVVIVITAAVSVTLAALLRVTIGRRGR